MLYNTFNNNPFVIIVALFFERAFFMLNSNKLPYIKALLVLLYCLEYCFCFKKLNYLKAETNTS